nr:MAG TPA: hypothetical protein [Caudoviricetes sp.]
MPSFRERRSAALMQTLEQVSGRSPHRLKRDFR